MVILNICGFSYGIKLKNGIQFILPFDHQPHEAPDELAEHTFSNVFKILVPPQPKVQVLPVQSVQPASNIIEINLNDAIIPPIEDNPKPLVTPPPTKLEEIQPISLKKVHIKKDKNYINKPGRGKKYRYGHENIIPETPINPDINFKKLYEEIEPTNKQVEQQCIELNKTITIINKDIKPTGRPRKKPFQITQENIDNLNTQTINTNKENLIITDLDILRKNNITHEDYINSTISTNVDELKPITLTNSAEITQTNQNNQINTTTETNQTTETIPKD